MSVYSLLSDSLKHKLAKLNVLQSEMGFLLYVKNTFNPKNGQA